MTITKVSNADWVVAFDGNQHRLLKNGAVVYQGNTITFVGPESSYGGHADITIDARHCLVIPGLINTHGHIGEGLRKGLREDLNNPYWKYGPVMAYSHAWGATTHETAVAYQAGLAEQIASGCTTLLDENRHDLASIQIVAESGMRAYSTRTYSSGGWILATDHDWGYDLDEARGMKALDEAVDFTRALNNGLYGDRVRAVLSPLSPDACLPGLLRATRIAADELQVPIHIHCAQWWPEFWSMIHRYGRTPVEVLYDHGLLGPDVSLGHCIYLNDHPQIDYRNADDAGLILSTGTTIDYAPWVMGLRGVLMHSFGRFYKAGINMSLGTDTYPQDMMEAMRWAAVFSKVAEGDPLLGTAAQVFNAATLGGAKWLRRDDLGRLAQGAKADIVLVNMNNSWMQPAHDPIKSLVYSATSRTVQTVIIDGQIVYDQGVLLTIDREKLVRDLPRAAERMVNVIFPGCDKHRRSPEQFAPLSFPVWEEQPVIGGPPR